MKYRSLLVLLLFAPFGGGCATIVKDETQPVSFDSEPPNAYVYVDGTRMGKTPTTIDVPRKGWDKSIRFEKKGHKPETYKLENQVDAAIAGNAIFGLWGVLTTGVDDISGHAGSYKDSVKVVLEPKEKADNTNADEGSEKTDNKAKDEGG
jgi:hypothetical protein